MCGVGGSGMSALAFLMQSRGWRVCGSDRSRDRGETPEKFAALAERGITLYPQDGSGITGETSLLIVSSAVEDTIPDVRSAKEKNVPIKKRAAVLAEMFNAADLSVGVAGTSGKSTTTAMTGWILGHAGKDPTVINGAQMANFDGRNAMTGDGPFVAEIDESDGSIALFNPSIAVVTNISLDHKSMEELRALFGGYLNRAKTAIVNLDDAELIALTGAAQNCLSFSLANAKADFYARDIVPSHNGVTFNVNGVPVRLRVPGRHNVANALAALAAAHAAGASLAEAAAALAEYRGIRRRFEFVGEKNGVIVIDDFAHNPDKIAATLRTLHEQPGRIIAIFQPHGYGPTKLMREELVRTFAANLAADDFLLMPEIYYAGGTATKDISSADIVNGITSTGKNAKFFSQRPLIVDYATAMARPGDRIVIMGARDDTLPVFAETIVQQMGRVKS